MGKIYESIQEFRLYRPHDRLVVTSGGFSPPHVGHVRCFRETAERFCSDWSTFLVIVNGDGFLKRKKGFVFMPLEERMEIIAAFKYVDAVVPFDDGSQFVTSALAYLKPAIFTKGGDRSDPSNVPEYETCREIGCSVVFGVGGYDKIQSSSKLVEQARQNQLIIH